MDIMVNAMTDDRKLPDKREGAGLIWNINGKLAMPIRDNGPIPEPKRLDGQMGRVEDELVKVAQEREGTEETAIVREGEQNELGVPANIRDSELEHNLVRTYRRAGSDENSPLPEIDDVFYYEASQQVPEGMPTTEVDAGHVTGYTFEITDDISEERVNELDVDLNPENIRGGDLALYDLEHMAGDEVTHFDRPVALLDPEDDQIEVYRSGECQYQGDVEGLKDFLTDEYDWDMSDVEHPATAKVQARLDAYDDQLGDQTREMFVNDEYMEALSDIGDAFRNAPQP